MHLSRIPHIRHRIAAKVGARKVGKYLCRGIGGRAELAFFLEADEAPMVRETLGVRRPQVVLHVGIDHTGGE